MDDVRVSLTPGECIIPLTDAHLENGRKNLERLCEAYPEYFDDGYDCD